MKIRIIPYCYRHSGLLIPSFWLALALYRMVQGPESILKWFWSLRQPADPQPASPMRRASLAG